MFNWTFLFFEFVLPFKMQVFCYATGLDWKTEIKGGLSVLTIPAMVTLMLASKAFDSMLEQILVPTYIYHGD